MIYISTGGFRNLKPQSIIKKFSSAGIKSIELSGGSYDEVKKIIKFLKKNKNLDYSLHNYFPVPKKNFVINLASVNKKVFNNPY